MNNDAIKDLKNFDGFDSPPSAVHEILNSALFNPIEDLTSRPSKNLRAQLVRAGFLFAQPERKMTARELHICSVLSDVLESIHAGSLIIDDIQDGSLERRGRPSLHETYGVPLALNAGNFLYFQPFAWIEALGLSEKTELKVYRLCHEAMMHAHLGQAIDLGTCITLIPRNEVEDLCRNSSLLKTGCLTALALALGAAAGGADNAKIEMIRKFGENFGLALQRFDDIGNLALREGDPKRFEDVRLRRPSWAWALAARVGGDSDSHYRSFVAAAENLPDTDLLEAWLKRENFFETAQLQNESFLNGALSAFEEQASARYTDDCAKSFAIIESLVEKLRSSYG